MNINQGQDINLRKLKRSLSKFSNSICLDINSINNDINKLEQIKQTVMSDKKNLGQLLDKIRDTKRYLESIKSLAETNDNVTLNWVISDNMIKSTPINFNVINLGKAEINTTDYIVLNDTRLICVDLSNLLSLIAFEIVHRDLGLTDRDIEENISNKSNIIGINDSAVFNEYIDNRFYEKALLLRVDDTAYKNILDNKLYSYYGDAVGKSDYYKDVLIQTYKKTMSIVLEYLLNILNDMSLNLQFIGITNSRIYFLDLSKSNNDSIKLRDKVDINIRVFGRNFKAYTDIDIY